jgi:F-type H+-transporting ATPase subunit alpha
MALSIYAVNEGYLDDVPMNKILGFEEALHAHFANTQGALMDRIVSTGAWDKDIEAVFKQGVSDFKTTGTW